MLSSTETTPASATGAMRGDLARAATLTRAVEALARLLVYTLLLVVFLLPFLWMFFGAVRREVEILTYMMPFSWHTIVPVEWSLESFLTIFGLTVEGRNANYRFHLGLMNSAIVAIACVASSLVINTMVAYFLARLPFPGKKYVLAFVLATFMLPADVTIVPLYLVVGNLGLLNTYWAIIVPYAANPFLIFMLTQFMYGLPKELDEAALVDGATYWQILWRVVFPNLVPALATASLLEFQAIWNLFYWPLVAVSSQELQVIQVMIATQISESQVYWGRIFAGMVSATLPVLLLFLAGQRYYFRGAVLSGMK